MRVTCYACHRGQPLSPAVWYNAQAPKQAGGVAAHRGTQNAPSPSMVVGLTSRPYDPFQAYLGKGGAGGIKVVSTATLPMGGGSTIQSTEGTSGLMMHISKVLGINCTYWHSRRWFAEWDQSSQQRVVAWHGLRMVGQLNAIYLESLKSQFPASRPGPGGDVPKANCATCHQGVFKALQGAAMVKDHPELLSKAPAPAAAPAPTPATEPAGAPAPGTAAPATK